MQDLTPTVPSVRVTVLYDADCGFCRWCVARLLALDRKGVLLPEPIQGPVGDRLLAELSAEERLATAHVVAADGRRWSGGDALAPVLAALGMPRTLPAATRALGGPVRWGYRRIADRRSAFGRLISDRRRRAADAAIARHRERALERNA